MPLKAQRRVTNAKVCFSIKTRSGQFIERIVIAGKDREDAERKLNQMYRYCEVVSCETQRQSGMTRKQAASVEEVMSLISR